MKYFRNANQRQRWIVIRWPEIQDLTKQTGFLNWQIISRTPLEGIFFFAVSAVDSLPCRVYQVPTYLPTYLLPQETVFLAIICLSIRIFASCFPII